MRAIVLFAALASMVVAGACESRPRARTTLAVQGLDCDRCAAKVVDALRDLPGVHEARVSFERGQALVDHEPARASLAVLTRAIEGAGYRVGPATGPADGGARR